MPIIVDETDRLKYIGRYQYRKRKTKNNGSYSARPVKQWEKLKRNNICSPDDRTNKQIDLMNSLDKTFIDRPDYRYLYQ